MKLSEMIIGDVTIAEDPQNARVYSSRYNVNFITIGEHVYCGDPVVPREVARAIVQWHRFFPVVPSGDRMHRKTDFFRVPRVTTGEALRGGWMTVDDSGLLVLTERGRSVPVRFVEPTVTIEIPLRLRDEVLQFVHDRN